MAKFTIDLDGLLMKNYKTYAAGIATMIAAGLGASGYIDVVTALTLANGLMGLGLIFLRSGVKKIQGPVDELLAKLPEIPE